MPSRELVHPQAPSQTAGRSWIPTADQLSYTKNLLEVFVLLLALPYLVHELFTSPIGLSERMAGHHSLS